MKKEVDKHIRFRLKYNDIKNLNYITNKYFNEAEKNIESSTYSILLHDAIENISNNLWNYLDDLETAEEFYSKSTEEKIVPYLEEDYIYSNFDLNSNDDICTLYYNIIKYTNPVTIKFFEEAENQHIQSINSIARLAIVYMSNKLSEFEPEEKSNKIKNNNTFIKIIIRWMDTIDNTEYDIINFKEDYDQLILNLESSTIYIKKSIIRSFEVTK